jgi:diaminopimelate epimerase
MRLRFTKMHGQGNDFVMIDGIRQPFTLARNQISFLADRHFGIGCDQLLVVEKPTRADVDFRYRIFNADGGEVEQCGNGARCFARFVREEGLSDKAEIRVETLSGVIVPRIEANGDVTVNMGAPRFMPEEIPLKMDHKSANAVYGIEVAGKVRAISALSMGNPHAVQVVENVDSAPVTTEGPLIENSPLFPNRVNAGYMQIVARDHIRLRVWERGAGETLACGSGACAAVVAGIRLGKLGPSVRVSTRGGDLTISWQGDGAPVMLSGAATTVYRGEIDLEKSINQGACIAYI